ncbi:MAG: hypothetical protein GF329_14255 [Candidatus Lokiarchaeota archaeon]|nr:hypothetical protein [Candidatus Lokiarchaeota archaeon]
MIELREKNIEKTPRPIQNFELSPFFAFHKNCNPKNNERKIVAPNTIQINL